MLRTIAVYSVMLGAPKCTRSKRILLLGASKFARSNRLLSRARSIEVCMEQPFTQTCSEHRDCVWINRFSIMSAELWSTFFPSFVFYFSYKNAH